MDYAALKKMTSSGLGAGDNATYSEPVTVALAIAVSSGVVAYEEVLVRELRVSPYESTTVMA